jgi:hypothetical protein
MPQILAIQLYVFILNKNALVAAFKTATRAYKNRAA